MVRLIGLVLALSMFCPAAPARQESGASCVGERVDGQPDGRWTFTSAAGDELLLARYRRGVLNGKFRLLWPSGETRAEVKYKRGKLSGELTFFDESGERFEPWCGEYRLSMKRWPSGELRSRGLLVDGLPHGSWRFVWPDGTPMLMAFFDRGEPVGTWTAFHLDGSPDELFFGRPWSGGLVADQLMELPWRVFFDPLLAEAGEPQPFVELLARAAPEPAPMGTLEQRAPALFEALGFGAPESLEPFDPDAETATRADLPALLATLLKLDSAGDAEALEKLFTGPVLALFLGEPLIFREAKLEDLHLAVCRLLFTWALTMGDPYWWEINVARSSAHGLGVYLRPLPEEAAGVVLGPPVDAFAGRFQDKKKQRRALGRDWRESLDEGLEALVAEQHVDGHWAGPRGHEVGYTGLALLALAGDGNTILGGEHADAVRRGVAWLLANQDPETGCFGIKPKGAHFLYAHFVASFALGELHGMAPSRELRLALEPALHYAARVRVESSGWQYAPELGSPPDASLTSWGTLALSAGLQAGISDAGVDGQHSLSEALAGGLDFIESMLDATSGRIGYNEPGSYSARITDLNEDFPVEEGEALTAAGTYALILGRSVLAGTEAAPSPGKWSPQMGLLLRQLPKWDASGATTDMYYWFFGSQAAFLVGDDAWKRWWPALLEAVFEGQGAATGGWEPIGPWGMIGGPTYSTAMMLLSLEAPIR